jgi:predicted deacylase
MIQSITFSSLQPGPRFLVLGAVHGNEKCGTHAIRRIVKEIEEKSLVIECGSVTFVPICNPKAFDADTRFIDRNLNRYLVPQDSPDCYEAQIGNVLCPILEQCDVLLDLHSYTVGGVPFVFVGPVRNMEYEFAESLGASAMMTGWQSAYAASAKHSASPDPEESTGTTEYARRFGAIALTLECGQHKDSRSNDVAYEAILRALAYLQITAPSTSFGVKAFPPLVEVKKVYYREVGEKFVKVWKHLQPVDKGELIATDDKGGILTAPDDGFIILPYADAPIGSEWFYWGQEQRR